MFVRFFFCLFFVTLCLGRRKTIDSFVSPDKSRQTFLVGTLTTRYRRTRGSPWATVKDRNNTYNFCSTFSDIEVQRLRNFLRPFLKSETSVKGKPSILGPLVLFESSSPIILLRDCHVNNESYNVENLVVWNTFEGRSEDRVVHERYKLFVPSLSHTLSFMNPTV